MGTSWSAKQMLAHYTTYYASDNPAVRDAMATIARNAFDNVATFVNQQNMQDALGQVAYQYRLRYEQRQQQLYEINLQYQADMAAIQAENDALLFYHTVNQTATVLKDPSFATHTVLDVVGLIPVVGEPADLLNASIYLAQGNYLDASLSAAGAIPFAGWAASGAQIVKSTYRAANAAMEVADTLGDGIRLADNAPLSAATPPASTITTFDPIPPMVKMPEAPIALPKTPDVAPPLKQIEAAPAAAVPDATTARFTAHPDGTIVDSQASAPGVGTDLERYYPRNNGFDGAPVDEVLQPGTVVGRTGYDGGRFAAPEGTPPQLLSLPHGWEDLPYSEFRVVEPLPVQAGPAAPWFMSLGGGTQYLLPSSIEDLVSAGVIVRVAP